MAEDDQTASETKKPKTRGARRQGMDPDNDGDAMGGDRDNDGDGGGRMWGSAQPRMMPWDRQAGGMQWGQPQGAPNGNTGVVGPGQGRPQMPWGGGFQPGGIMGGQGQQGGMPNWQALAQQFAQRFAQNNPFLQRLGMTGQGQMPPGQAPAGPPQGQPGGTPPIWAGPQAAQGQPQPGAAPQGGAFAPQIQRLAAMFGRQQPGGIVGPGQGPQNY